MAQTDDSFDLTLAAATLRSNSTDVQALMKALCDELADALGQRLRIQRKSGRFKRSDAITSVQIVMANDSFDATLDGPTVRCTVGRISGGIRIRSEAVGMDEWVVRLLKALQGEAAHSDAARTALENIVIGGNS